MSTSFPSALDVLTNPAPTDYFDTPGVELDLQIDNLNDAMEAVQAKVGTNTSIVTTSLDYKMSHHQHSGSDGSASYSALTLQTAAVGTTALIVKRLTSQSAPLQQWQDESASVLAQITSTGAAVLPAVSVSGVSALSVTTMTAGSSVQVPSTIKGFASQTADLTKWQNSSAVDLARVSASGMIRAPFFGSGVDATDPFQAILSTGPQFTAQATGARPKMGVRAFNTGSTDTLRLYTDVAGGTYPLELSATAVAATKPVSVQGTSQPLLKVGDGSLDTLQVDTTTDIVKVLNSGLLAIYSDNGSTIKASINGANGNAVMAGNVYAPSFMPSTGWTSASHPSSPLTGTEVYESDTGLWVYWDSTAWVPKPGQFLATQVVGANTPAVSDNLSSRVIGNFTFTMPNLGSFSASKRYVKVELNIASIIHATTFLPALHSICILSMKNAANTVVYRTANSVIHGVDAVAPLIDHNGVHLVQYFSNTNFAAGATATIALTIYCSSATGKVGVATDSSWTATVV